MINSLKYLLKQDKEQELLQSFVRVEPEKENIPKGKQYVFQAKLNSRHIGFTDDVKLESKVSNTKKDSEMKQKRKTKAIFNDTYTDKDRAAAVSAGSYDIKQSLQLKKQRDQNEVLQLTDEADVSSLISLGLKEIKNANAANAIVCFSKALELNNTDVNALVARSKCYLLLGEPSKALEDAEMALIEDANNMRAIYQKAESLYYLGQFEQSLMFFHRVLRARPELDLIRLGVQKTQEAVQNTLGTSRHVKPCKEFVENPSKSKQRGKGIQIKKEMGKKVGRKLLEELRVDKDYLENLLKHPDLKKENLSTENVLNLATEAVTFLDKREEFWRQQRSCSLLLSYRNIPQDAVPFWF
ncbi:outer dynein arm-docking complex subunit 4 [Episyrphus balteatus]|uniref:outer dynein arm-docking complex subunit 4 n=1 Tax=Episyrphus balteatus TaxID=286459 RepID=UPI002486318B|nr:outer dynein arm-docking complex subunit 4 [Episyrphus balteatus]